MATLFMYKFGSADYTDLFRAMERDGLRSIFQVAFHFRKNLKARWSRPDAYRYAVPGPIDVDPDSSTNGKDSKRTVNINSSREQARAAAAVENTDTLPDKGAEQVCTL